MPVLFYAEKQKLNNFCHNKRKVFWWLMKEIILRDYQKECVDIINNMNSGSGLACMGTGLGKTACFTHIERKGRILILSHREELVYQPQKYYDCSFGVERAEEHSNGEDVVSASVQTLYRRLKRFNPRDFDTIITDEAHHAVAPSYLRIYQYFKPRLHIGFTATPNRGDKKGLKKIFKKVIFNKDLKWGIENGYLCNINCVRVEAEYDMRKIKKVMGDFQLKDLASRVDNPVFNKQVAEAYEKYAKGQTLIFAVNISHAHNISRRIPGSVVITSETKNCAAILADFMEKKIKCIVNCMVLTEGTDLPCIETIIMARPTMNSSLYAQMVGRGLRLYPGKECLNLIDMVGVAGSVEICTAPDLIGKDEKNIPRDRRQNLKGAITEMDQVMENDYDIPKVWILNSKRVDVFAQTHDVAESNANWILQYDNSLFYQFSNNDFVKITPENAVGEVSLIWYHSGQLTKVDGLNVKSAILTAEKDIFTRYEQEKSLWDKAIASGWGKNPVSDSQINYIRYLCTPKDLDGIDLKTLTSGQASFIISQAKAKKAQKKIVC